VAASTAFATATATHDPVTPEPTPATKICDTCRYPPNASPPMPTVREPALTEDSALQNVIRDAIAGEPGEISVVVIDVDDRRYAAIDPSRSYYAASLFKLPVLIEAAWQEANGGLDPQRVVVINHWYAALDLGTMAPLGLHEGDTLPISQAIRLMTVASDNALANLVGDIVGWSNVDRDIRALGATDTLLEDPELPTTAADMAGLLAAIARGEPTQPVADQVFDLLSQQEIRSRIPSGIPDDGSVVGNKTGDYAGAAHDVAIVRAPFGTYVLAILSNGWEASDTFMRVASAVHEYLGSTATP
jgi:beta-lactamase class A